MLNNKSLENYSSTEFINNINKPEKIIIDYNNISSNQLLKYNINYNNSIINIKELD